VNSLANTMSSFGRALYLVFLFWYVMGMLLLSFNLLPTWLEWANAVFLILCGLLGFFYFYHAYGKKISLSVSSIIFIISMLAESIGVQFGLFFGEYNYGPDFGLQLFGVPIAIGFAWIWVIASTHALAREITIMLKSYAVKLFCYVLLGTFFAVAIDLIIDPVAVSRSYWLWDTEGFYYGIPFFNFVGWFILSLIFHGMLALILHVKELWLIPPHRLWTQRIVWVYLLVIIMFNLLALLTQLYLAVTLSLSTTLLIIWLYWISIKKQVT